MLGIACFIANKTAHEQGYYNERDSEAYVFVRPQENDKPAFSKFSTYIECVDL